MTGHTITSSRTRTPALLMLALLSGCKHDECKIVYHDQLRHKYFEQCIETMNRQPDHNHEDNNGHLVEACDNAARAQSNEIVCKEVEGFGL